MSHNIFSFPLSKIKFKFTSLDLEILFLLHCFFRLDPKLDLLIQRCEDSFKILIYIDIDGLQFKN